MRLIHEEHGREVNLLHMKVNQAESECYTLERQLQQQHTSSPHTSSSLHAAGQHSNHGACKYMLSL